VIELVVSEVAYGKPGALGILSTHPTASPTARVIYTLLLAAAGVAYAGLLLGHRGQTVGMMVVGRQAVDQSIGRRLSKAQSWRRAITLYMITGVWSFAAFVSDLDRHTTHHVSLTTGLFELATLAFSLLTFLWPLGSSRNQTLQDKAAGSVVVLKDPEVGLLPQQ
jgi:uncharacterized RDD family membrane protein YckC